MSIDTWAQQAVQPKRRPTARALLGSFLAWLVGARLTAAVTRRMPHVSIARSALRELRERIARYKYPTGIRIIGPLEEDCRAPEGVEDAWLIEKLYGPPQRWVLTIVALDELEEKTVEPGESFHVEEVSGIAVGILTSKTVQRLHIELQGDAIRVYELDA